MLEEVRIRNLGVIDDAVLELGPGFTALTGETGAGKTLVVTGLGLLLGGKADPGSVRSGAGSASVEGRIRLDPGSPAALRALDAGAELDDDVLIVSRTVSGSRSRAHLGGRGVPAQVLVELADDLVAVHGQSDQHRLLRPARQRGALDHFAGGELRPLIEDYGRDWVRLRELDARLDELTTRRQEREQEAALLRFGLERLEAVDPAPGEDLALREEDERLGNADALRHAAALAQTALQGDPDDPQAGVDVGTLLESARRALDAVRGHDAALGGLADRVAETVYLVADVGSELAAYATALDADPARLAAVQERRAVLGQLTRTHGPTVDDALAWGQQAAARLVALEGTDDEIDALGTERAALRARLGERAGRISAARTAAALELGERVTAELRALAMPRAQVSIEVRQREDPDGLEVAGRRLAAGSSGVDEVEMLLAANPGAAPRPLGKGASGGELSRVMLGLEVALAGVDPVPTFVFDEVDAGVGGKAAVEIGRRLAALSRTAQVLVVTHLPQVAAFADTHLVVVKDDDGSVTRSGVTLLDGEGRVEELSRMLAGLEGSATARAHAEELLETARRPVEPPAASPPSGSPPPTRRRARSGA